MAGFLFKQFLGQYTPIYAIWRIEGISKSWNTVSSNEKVRSVSTRNPSDSKEEIEVAWSWKRSDSERKLQVWESLQNLSEAGDVQASPLTPRFLRPY